MPQPDDLADELAHTASRVMIRLLVDDALKQLWDAGVSRQERTAFLDRLRVLVSARTDLANRLDVLNSISSIRFGEH